MNVQQGRLAGNQPQTPRANYKNHINFIPLDSNLCESVFVFTSTHINYTSSSDVETSPTKDNYWTIF